MFGKVRASRCSVSRFSTPHTQPNHTNTATFPCSRITDLRFTRSCAQMCTCRGTLTIMSGDESDPVLRITTFGTLVNATSIIL